MESSGRVQSELLARTGALLLEYNESTGAIHRVLSATAAKLTSDACQVTVFYGGVAVSLAGEPLVTLSVKEIRYNSVVQARVHDILNLVRRGELAPKAAIAQLAQVEAHAKRHPRWVVTVLLGFAAASLARLLGADANAAAIAGVATGLGLVARQELGRRHFSLLSLPFTAAFIGAVLGGWAIRSAWTQTPELVLIVPGLMLVPGPHLINGILDLLDNYLPMCLARLGLATGILLACALGIVLGIELTLPDPLLEGRPAQNEKLNVVTDMLLAGVATCGFAAFYNTAWRQVGLAVAGGMAGHGLRFVTMKAGIGLEAATFVGAFAVGVISAWMARGGRIPVAIISFAGAVTMMPGLQMYRALGGALKLARSINAADQTVIASTLGNALQAGLVVGALAVGLIFGARIVQACTGELSHATAHGKK